MKAAKKRPRPDGGKVKAIEKTGRPIHAGLKSRDPFGDKQCPFPTKCWSDQNTDCTKPGSIYKVTCLNCGETVQNGNKTIYLGTSGHTHHHRMTQHEAACSRPSGPNSSSIAKHQAITHPGMEPRFSSCIVDSNPRNLYRMVTEALTIEEMANTSIPIKQKSERGKLSLPRIHI